MMNMSKEQLFAIELDAVRDADVADVPTWAGSTDRLHYRFLGAYALQHRVRADAVGQILDASHSLVTVRSQSQLRQIRVQASAGMRDGSLQ